MSLSVEELLRPRYKVISDYPQPPFNEETDEHKFIEGDLLVQGNVNGIITFRRYGRLGHMSVGVPCIAHPEKYPKIFQPLPWWSDRKPEDMPKYLRWRTKDQILKIVRYDDNGEFYYLNENDICGYCTDYTNPATEDEYTAYINQKQQ